MSKTLLDRLDDILERQVQNRDLLDDLSERVDKIAPRDGDGLGGILPTFTPPPASDTVSRGESMVDWLRHRRNVETNTRVSTGSVIYHLLTGKGDEHVEKAVAEGSDSTGGVDVPLEVLGTWIDLARAKSRVIEAGAQIVPLDATAWKSSITKITADPTPYWVAESSNITTSQPTFSKVEFSPKVLAVAIPVSRQILEDSVNVAKILDRVTAEAMAGELDRVCLLGSGSGQEPKGLVNYTAGDGLNVYYANTSSAGAVLTYSKLFSALTECELDNVDPDAVILNPSIYEKLVSVNDSTGQFIQPPSRLASVRFLKTSKIATNLTTGNGITSSSYVFGGGFSDLYIGLRAPLRIEVFREPLALSYSHLLIASMRVDVQPARLSSMVRIDGCKLS